MMAFIGLQVGLNANGCHQTVYHQRQLVFISGLKNGSTLMTRRLSRRRELESDSGGVT